MIELMMSVAGVRAIFARKSVDCSSTDPVCKEKGWPGESKEVDAARLHSEKHGEWINEECEEDVGSTVNTELSQIEKKLKKEELCGMECKVSGISNRSARGPHEVDEIKDSLTSLGTSKASGISSCTINLDLSGWWRVPAARPLGGVSSSSQSGLAGLKV